MIKEEGRKSPNQQVYSDFCLHFIKRTIMAASKTSHHVRSISLPSTTHPIANRFEENLCRLRSSQTASTSSSSVSHNLSILGDLYTCVDELLHLPINQQSITQDCRAKWLEDMLDESLRLLDICTIAKDALLQIKENIQNIQSVLRRRFSGELIIDIEIVQYMNARKMIKKTTKNCLKDMKKVSNNDATSPIAGMLKDVETMTDEIFNSMLVNIGGSKTLPMKNGWSLVSKLVHQKSDKESTASTSRFDDLDSVLSTLISQKKKISINMMHVDSLTNQMGQLESEIQDLDGALEIMFRHLVKTRATLLNILSN